MQGLAKRTATRTTTTTKYILLLKKSTFLALAVV